MPMSSGSRAAANESAGDETSAPPDGELDHRGLAVLACDRRPLQTSAVDGDSPKVVGPLGSTSSSIKAVRPLAVTAYSVVARHPRPSPDLDRAGGDAGRHRRRLPRAAAPESSGLCSRKLTSVGGDGSNPRPSSLTAASRLRFPAASTSQRREIPVAGVGHLEIGDPLDVPDRPPDPHCFFALAATSGRAVGTRRAELVSAAGDRRELLRRILPAMTTNCSRNASPGRQRGRALGTHRRRVVDADRAVRAAEVVRGIDGLDLEACWPSLSPASGTSSVSAPFGHGVFCA